VCFIPDAKYGRPRTCAAKRALGPLQREILIVLVLVLLLLLVISSSGNGVLCAERHHQRPASARRYPPRVISRTKIFTCPSDPRRTSLTSKPSESSRDSVDPSAGGKALGGNSTMIRAALTPFFEDSPSPAGARNTA